jgi:hypothetical protein
MFSTVIVASPTKRGLCAGLFLSGVYSEAVTRTTES